VIVNSNVHSNLHAVILAGGSGTRFWPLSREQSPKQLLDVFGQDSLLISALDRAEEVIGESGQIHIVVSKDLHDELQNHILSHEKWGSMSINYIIEPAARNTASALALAAAVVEACDPGGIIAMLPSDHIVERGERWIATMGAAVEGAADGSLVTVGLKPTGPETGYGYIQAKHTKRSDSVLAVKRFVEKPDYDTALSYLVEGNYYWNSGMLVARADTILAELEAVQIAHPDAPSASGNREIVEVSRALAKGADSADTRTRFGKLSNEPFDKAVLELSGKVKVVPATIDWSDVGSLLALEALQEPNERGTRVIGQGIDIDSVNTTSYSSKRLVATLGLTDTIVVDTEDATLIAAKDRVQDVRKVVEDLQRCKAPEAMQSQVSLRPWGSWTIVARADGYQVKEVKVHPGQSLSLQKHQQRSEHWVVVEGRATVQIDGETKIIEQGQSVFIPMDTLHRLSNNEKSLLHIVEVAVGDYLGEDDIERFDDRYDRQG